MRSRASFLKADQTAARTPAAQEARELELLSPKNKGAHTIGDVVTYGQPGQRAIDGPVPAKPMRPYSMSRPA